MGRYVQYMSSYGMLSVVVCGGQCLSTAIGRIGGALGSSGLVEVIGLVIECFMALYPVVR